MRPLVGILSCAAVLTILLDAFETMILPRRVIRRARLTALFYRSTWPLWSALVRRIPKPRLRESALGYYGPFSTLALLVSWAFGMMLSFAGLHWALATPVSAPEKHADFWTYLYMSGTDYLTLGLGDVAPLSLVGRGITVAEAGLGFGFLCIVIGYLPVLYQAFSRREMNISLLDARAGSPPSALELLRHFGGGGAEPPAATLHEAERWTAELLESHISYPVLSYFRSQHDNQSWLASLTAILDGCALVQAVISELGCRQAQLTFAMARHTVVDIAQILRTPPRAPSPDRLGPEQLERLRAGLAQAGLRLDTSDAALERLAALRALYEPYVNALSQRLVMRLPDWAPERRAIHNWETSAWGRASAAASAASNEAIEDDHT
ncbi:MAG TPA: potassium channel family protein [Bryobacteraceae bacterium]|nr:potassium channel family protein [Bryobacteraceae bacterium]